MSQARSGHTATLLSDGRVLVSGGQNSSGVLRTAELYDPSTARFASTGSMAQTRTNAAATLLADGRVLITGGFAFTAETSGNLVSAEIYNPVTGQFAATGPMNLARAGHAATLLHDGRVFVVGGTSSSSRQAEIYDPATSTFTTLPLMLTVRQQALAFTLPSGNVLVVGGNAPGAAGAEVYNVTKDAFELAPPRTLFSTGIHGTAVLASGEIVFAGALNENGITAQSEVFDPRSNEFESVGAMALARSNHAGAIIGDGRALFTGGSAVGGDQTVTTTSSAEVFDPATDRFSITGAMTTPRAGHTATSLNNGTVLVIGGANGGQFLSSAELYLPDVTNPAVSRRRAARH
jgi:hypothetical protein